MQRYYGIKYRLFPLCILQSPFPAKLLFMDNIYSIKIPSESEYYMERHGAWSTATEKSSWKWNFKCIFSFLALLFLILLLPFFFFLGKWKLWRSIREKKIKPKSKRKTRHYIYWQSKEINFYRVFFSSLKYTDRYPYEM